MDLIKIQLEEAGHDTTVFGLATVNQPELKVQDDVAALTGEVLHPLIEDQGKDIVLYLHSYAGFPGSAAIKGLSKTERLAAGKRGGLRTGLVSVIDPKATFYADVAEPVASEAADRIRPQSILSLNTALSQTFYDIPAYDDRRVYLLTCQDEALPAFAQEAFVRDSGIEWDVHKLDTSHSPFLSEPEQLAAIVEAKVKDFVASY
ncbi:MAG: hypothetical protein Q9204_006761 [Flavoplaca sp. TL-2023a]